MLNKINKQQAINVLSYLRDELIERNAEDEDMSVERQYFEPDCIEYAINFLLKHKDAE